MKMADLPDSTHQIAEKITNAPLVSEHCNITTYSLITQLSNGVVKEQLKLIATSEFQSAISDINVDTTPVTKNVVKECVNDVNTSPTSDDVKQCLNDVDTTPPMCDDVKHSVNDVDNTTPMCDVKKCVNDVYNTPPISDDVNKCVNDVDTGPPVCDDVKECVNNDDTRLPVCDDVKECVNDDTRPPVYYDEKECLNDDDTRPPVCDDVKECVNDEDTRPPVCDDVKECVNDVDTRPTVCDDVKECVNDEDTRPPVCDDVNECVNDENTRPLVCDDVKECLNEDDTRPPVWDDVKECVNDEDTRPSVCDYVKECLNDEDTRPVCDDVKECVNDDTRPPVCDDVNECVNDVDTRPPVCDDVKECVNDVNTRPPVCDDVKECVNDGDTRPPVCDDVKECLNDMDTRPPVCDEDTRPPVCDNVKDCVNDEDARPPVCDDVKEYLNDVNTRPPVCDDVKECLNDEDTRPPVCDDVKEYLNDVNTRPPVSDDVKDCLNDENTRPPVCDDVKECVNDEDSRPPVCNDVTECLNDVNTRPPISDVVKKCLNDEVTTPPNNDIVKECFNDVVITPPTNDNMKECFNDVEISPASDFVKECLNDVDNTPQICDVVKQCLNDVDICPATSDDIVVKHYLNEDITPESSLAGEGKLLTITQEMFNSGMPGDSQDVIISSMGCYKSERDQDHNYITKSSADKYTFPSFSTNLTFQTVDQAEGLPSDVLETSVVNCDDFPYQSKSQVLTSEGLQLSLIGSQCVADFPSDTILNPSENVQHSLPKERCLSIASDAMPKTTDVKTYCFSSQSRCGLMTSESVQQVLNARNSNCVAIPSESLQKVTVVNCDDFSSQSKGGLLINPRKASQLETDYFVETQESYVYSSCGISEAAEQSLQTINSSLIVSLAAAEFQDTEQGILPKDFQTITINSVSSRTVEFDQNMVMSSCLPVYQVSTGTVGSENSSQSVPSRVPFSQHADLSSSLFSQSDSPIQQGLCDPLMHENSSLCTLPVLPESAADPVSYSYLPYSVADAPQLKIVPSAIIDCANQSSLIEPATQSNSSGVTISIEDCDIADTFFFNVNSASNISQNDQISVCEKEAIENSVNYSEENIDDVTLTNPSVFMGNDVEDHSLNELVTKSNHSENEYFDLCHFMSSAESSPVKLASHSAANSTNAHFVTDIEQFLSKMKNDDLNDQISKNVLPSVVDFQNIPKRKLKLRKVLSVKKPKPVKKNSHYVKPSLTFSNKSNLSLIGGLQPFCKCTEPADENLMISDQTIFACGQQILLPQIRKVACCGFELISMHRGYMMFVCVKQLLNFGLMDQVLFKKIKKSFPDHTCSMTRDEILFMKHHTGIINSRSGFNLISLELLAFALENLPDDEKKMFADHDEPLFYEVRLGHHCEKTRSLIKTVSDPEKTFVKKTSKSVADPKRMVTKAMSNLTDFEDSQISVKKTHKRRKNDHCPSSDHKMFVVDRPDGEGFCLAEVKTVLVADKQLMSFSWLDDTYINCLQLCQNLADFPWENFQELANSLNVKFSDAPPEVQTHFTKQGHSRDIVSGKWTSIANLRLISCFSVGQMNNTDFLIKNSILTKIATGDFKETTAQPPDILQLAASEIRDSMEDHDDAQIHDGHLSQCKDTKIVSLTQSSKHSLNNCLQQKGIAVVHSAPQARKSGNTKTNSVRENIYSSQKSLIQQDCLAFSEMSGAPLNFEDHVKSDSTSAYMHRNNSDFVTVMDCNDNIVFVESREGSLFECTPLYAMQKTQKELDINMSSAVNNKSVSSVLFTEKALLQIPSTIVTSDDKCSRSLTSVNSNKSVDLFEVSPKDSGSDFASVDFDILLGTPKNSDKMGDYHSNETKANTPSKRVLTISPEKQTAGFVVNQDNFKSPDSGIYLDVKAVSDTPQLENASQDINKQQALLERCLETEALETGDVVEKIGTVKQLNRQTVQQLTPPISRINGLENVSYVEFDNHGKLELAAVVHPQLSFKSSKDLHVSCEAKHVPSQTHVINGSEISKIMVDSIDAISENTPSSKESVISCVVETLDKKTPLNCNQRVISPNDCTTEVCRKSFECELVEQAIKKSAKSARSSKTECKLTTSDSMNSDCEHLLAQDDKTVEKTVEAIPYSKSYLLVDAFKHLLPMINITSMVDRDHKVKFHLSIRPSIKHMLMKSGDIETDVENVERFLKVISRLIVRAQWYVKSQKTVNSMLSVEHLNTCAMGGYRSSHDNQQPSNCQPYPCSKDTIGTTIQNESVENVSSNKKIVPVMVATDTDTAALSKCPGVVDHDVHLENNRTVTGNNQTFTLPHTMNDAKKVCLVSNNAGEKQESFEMEISGKIGGDMITNVSSPVTELGSKKKNSPCTAHRCLPRSPNHQKIRYIFSENICNLLKCQAVDKTDISVNNVSSAVPKKRKKITSVKKISDSDKSVAIKPESEDVQKKFKLTAKKTFKYNSQQRKPEFKETKPKPKQRKSEPKHKGAILKNGVISIGQMESNIQNGLVKRKRGRPRKKPILVTHDCVSSPDCVTAKSMTTECIGLNTDFVTHPDIYSSTGPVHDTQTPKWMFSGNEVFIPPFVREGVKLKDGSIVYDQLVCETNTLFTNLNHQEADSEDPESSTEDACHITKQKLTKKRKHIEGKFSENTKFKRVKF